MRTNLLKYLSMGLMLPIVPFSHSTAIAQSSSTASACGGEITPYLNQVVTPRTAQQFSGACKEHLTCYQSYGASKQACDEAFLRIMQAYCQNTAQAVLGLPRQRKCNSFANAYYKAAVNNGQATYNQAQAAARPTFSWSQAGPIKGQYCTRIHEDGDPYSWDNNYLCSNKELGLKWSQVGHINGMKCTQIYEDGDPNGWDNNYLCLPQESAISFRWSQVGPVSGLQCLKVYEDADPNGWDNNYLCW